MGSLGGETERVDRGDVGLPEGVTAKASTERICYLDLLGPYPTGEGLDINAFDAMDEQPQPSEPSPGSEKANGGTASLGISLSSTAVARESPGLSAAPMPSHDRLVLSRSSKDNSRVPPEDSQDDAVRDLISEYGRVAKASPRPRLFLNGYDYDNNYGATFDRRVNGRRDRLDAEHDVRRRGSAPETASSGRADSMMLPTGKDRVMVYQTRLPRRSSLLRNSTPPPSSYQMDAERRHQQRSRTESIPQAQVKKASLLADSGTTSTRKETIKAKPQPRNSSHSLPGTHLPRIQSRSSTRIAAPPPQPGPAPTRPLPAPPGVATDGTSIPRRKKRQSKRAASLGQVQEPQPTPRAEVSLPTGQAPLTPPPEPDTPSNQKIVPRSGKEEQLARRQWVREKRIRDLQEYYRARGWELASVKPGGTDREESAVAGRGEKLSKVSDISESPSIKRVIPDLVPSRSGRQSIMTSKRQAMVIRTDLYNDRTVTSPCEGKGVSRLKTPTTEPVADEAKKVGLAIRSSVAPSESEFEGRVASAETASSENISILDRRIRSSKAFRPTKEAEMEARLAAVEQMLVTMLQSTNTPPSPLAPPPPFPSPPIGHHRRHTPQLRQRQRWSGPGVASRVVGSTSTASPETLPRSNIMRQSSSVDLSR